MLIYQKGDSRENLGLHVLAVLSRYRNCVEPVQLAETFQHFFPQKTFYEVLHPHRDEETIFRDFVSCDDPSETRTLINQITPKGEKIINEFNLNYFAYLADIGTEEFHLLRGDDQIRFPIDEVYEKYGDEQKGFLECVAMLGNPYKFPFRVENTYAFSELPSPEQFLRDLECSTLQCQLDLKRQGIQSIFY